MKRRADQSGSGRAHRSFVLRPNRNHVARGSNQNPDRSRNSVLERKTERVGGAKPGQRQKQANHRNHRNVGNQERRPQNPKQPKTGNRLGEKTDQGGSRDGRHQQI